MHLSGYTMLRVERQAKILQFVREKGYVHNDELARMFGVTQTTIRRDLKTLHEQNLVMLEHGGSFVSTHHDDFIETQYTTKEFLCVAQKQSIGNIAASLIQDGSSIILDSGTTNLQIARHIRMIPYTHLTVFTSDLMIAKEICTETAIQGIMLGGLIRNNFYNVYGPYTEIILKNIKADKYFLGIDAFSFKNGVSAFVLEEVPIKQLMMENSKEIIMVADSSKFGKDAVHKVCTPEHIDVVITDDCIDEEYINQFQTKGIRCRVAPVDKKICGNSKSMDYMDPLQNPSIKIH